MNNLELFEYSKNNPEKFFDEYYMFVKKHPDLDKYTKTTKDIKETLIAIKKIKEKSGTKETLDELSKSFICLFRSILIVRNLVVLLMPAI
jgi:hypothetical protein